VTRPLCFLEYRTKQEDNESEEEVIRYCHGPGIDEPISIEKDNKTYYYHYDGLGSVIALTDKNQKITDSYSYDSFGNLKRQGNKVKNSYAYTGREFDKETGLYYYRNRYYDSKIGRFITTDPIGYAGGINLYAYVGNNPVNWIDSYGLRKEFRIRTIAGAGGGVILGGEFTTFEIEYVATGQRQFYSFAGAGAAFGGKVGVGGGVINIDWVTGPSAGENVAGIGWETGFAGGVQSSHGVMFRR